MINSKRKGNAGERNWAQFLREQNLDRNARRNVSSGSTYYKSDVHNSINYNFEVKVGKHFSLPKALKQTQRDAEMAHSKPAIPFHLDGMRDDSWWIVIDAYEWAELIKRNKEPISKAPDREMKWKIQRLVEAAKQVMKIFDS